MMQEVKMRVDLESDALYFRISEEEIEESEEVSLGVILDYSKDGRVVGIEILGLKGFPLKELVEMRGELPTLKRGEK